jgi:hypothetical protein
MTEHFAIGQLYESRDFQKDHAIVVEIVSGGKSGRLRINGGIVDDWFIYDQTFLNRWQLKNDPPGAV